jgi:hypothetical protein
MSDTIITKELVVDKMGACNIGPDFIEANNLWGQPESVVLPALAAAGLTADVDWWLNKKKTEKFVRCNGKVITMTTNYQVFNPLTGLHDQFASEAEAKEALARVCEAIIDNYKPTVCQEITNENGDSAWTSVDLVATRKVTIE